MVSHSNPDLWVVTKNRQLYGRGPLAQMVANAKIMAASVNDSRGIHVNVLFRKKTRSSQAGAARQRCPWEKFRSPALVLLVFLIHLAMSAVAFIGSAAAQAAAEHHGWPGRGQLFVGANYQPVDRTPEQIHQDIALMKRSGFSVIRMGDLSWDAFEPREGQFDFAWFDKIMDEMSANGIRVILEIGGQPAPLWLHHRYPGVDIVAQNGTVQHPAERYMDDISDPDYRRLLLQYADVLTKHYAKHPAIIALGYNNEIGNGFLSYSEADRQRFIAWVKAKYGTLDAVNKAWAGQRWSRRISDWDEIQLPNGDGPGPVERYLDLHRFWSDQIVSILRDLDAVRKRNMPDVPAVSNLYAESHRKGLDYLGSYRGYTTYGAMGFYPFEPLGGALSTMMIKGALPTPVWFNEFTAGGNGDYGVPGRSRMWAYFGLLNQAQTFLAWTFNSHLGGEEQALFGLVDHDDTPSWKLDEWAQIATEFRTLEKLGFPRFVEPQVALAYSYDTFVASSVPGPSTSLRDYYKTPYMSQIRAAFQPFLVDNIDAAVIDIGYDTPDSYKLLIVPGQYIMDQKNASAIRRYVEKGGTVVMTAYSAKADEHGQWFNQPLPGRLSDVFGIRTNAFYRSNEPLSILFNGQTIAGSDKFYEVVEPGTAQTLANFVSTPEKSPAITINNFGRGRAIYVAATAQETILGPLVRSLYASLGIQVGPQTPAGVFARSVDGQTLYVNTTTETKEIPITSGKTGVMSGTHFIHTIVLQPYGVELVK